MKKIGLVFLIGFVFSCGEQAMEEESNFPPEENRFIKEVFVSNLYEPTELVILPDEKILFTQRRGGIWSYDLNTAEFIQYDSIAVYHENEDGLMGMALDPEFEQNNWIYLYYSPVGDTPVQNLSRFNYTPSGLTDEVIVMQVPVQRDECCHTGGSIQFGPDGLLYLSTGDNTNPFASNGYSPSDERPGRAAWDAQRTSSNTNDLRGKILRIKPQADGSYSIPDGNLFEDDDPITRPEIYVMGCRNPYRISVDSKRNWLFWGDVGPDANEDGENRGPRGHDEFNVAQSAGYYGWPLFVGNNSAYRDFDFAANESGPAFDPKKPVNNSPNNTGLKQLPPARPAKIYYPYAKHEVFPQVNNGGRNAMAGPVYYADEYNGTNKFPTYFDGRVLFFDWIRGFIYFLELDESGNPADWYPFMPKTEFNNVIDMEFGPDGSLYMIEYGTGWFTQNLDARLSRINYVKGNRTPILNATLSKRNGAAPLEVVFDASSSIDYDDDKLQYAWHVDNEKFKDSIFTHTFEKEGVYYPELVLSDGKGNEQRKQFVVEVGNEPPVVTINIIGNQSFFWKGREVSYDVSVNDMEDEQAKTGIDKSTILFDIAHYQSSDLAESLGHQVPVSDGLSLIQSMDCKSCHKAQEQSIGPSYTAVAERYQNDQGALNYLTHKIINGGGGVWGEQAMAAHPDLSNEDAQRIVEYILSLAHTNNYPLSGAYTTDKSVGRYLFTAMYEDQGKEPLRPIQVTENRWLLPTKRTADIFDSSEGIQVRRGRINRTYHGSWIGYQQIDLTDMAQIRLYPGNIDEGGTISVRTGSAAGESLGSVSLMPGADKDVYTIDLNPVSGYHDLYITFQNEGEENNLLAINEIEFVPKRQR